MPGAPAAGVGPGRAFLRAELPGADRRQVRRRRDGRTVRQPGRRNVAPGEPGNWEPDEWADLLAGKLGPWAMVVAGTTVVSICHTPASSSHGAEAGTWTRPDRRGRGYAAAATAAWASLFTGGQQLFYSTSAANQSSQRVAARLNLRLIGWLWKVSPASQP